MKERQWKYLRVLPAPTISSIRVNFAFRRRAAKRLSEKIRKVRNVFIDSLKCISKFSAARRNVGHCDVLNSVQWRKHNADVNVYIFYTRDPRSPLDSWKHFFEFRDFKLIAVTGIDGVPAKITIKYSPIMIYLTNGLIETVLLHRLFW